MSQQYITNLQNMFPVPDDSPHILCIPGVFSNIKEDRIRRVFQDLNLGEVIRVDIVMPKKPIGSDEKENKFNRVFIHLDWNQTEQSIIARDRLTQGKDIKIIYDEPWFWRVSAYKAPTPKPSFQSQSKPRAFQPKKATIQFDFESNININAFPITGIAPALSIPEPTPIQIKEEKSQKSQTYKPKPKSKSKQYDEFGWEIKEEIIDYGNQSAPQKRKKNIIQEDENTKK